MLEVGTKAPDFTLPDQNGVMHSLQEYAGRKLILYFYSGKIVSYGVVHLLYPLGKFMC